MVEDLSSGFYVPTASLYFLSCASRNNTKASLTKESYLEKMHRGLESTMEDSEFFLLSWSRFSLFFPTTNKLVVFLGQARTVPEFRAVRFWFRGLATKLQNMLYRCDCRLKASARGDGGGDTREKKLFWERVLWKSCFFLKDFFRFSLCVFQGSPDCQVRFFVSAYWSVLVAGSTASCFGLSRRFFFFSLSP